MPDARRDLGRELLDERLLRARFNRELTADSWISGAAPRPMD